MTDAHPDAMTPPDALPAIRDVLRDASLRGARSHVYLTLRYDPEFRLSATEYRAVKQLALAVHLRVSLRTVEDAIASLIRLGYIEAGTRIPGSPQCYKLLYVSQREVA